MGIGIGNTNNSNALVNNYFGGSPPGQMDMMPQNSMMQMMMQTMQMMMHMMHGLTGGPCQQMGGMMPGMGGMMPGMGSMGCFSPVMGNCLGNFMGMGQSPLMGGMMPGGGGMPFSGAYAGPGGAGAYAGGPGGSFAGAYAGPNGAGAVAGAGGPVSGQFSDMINMEARKNGVDPALVKAIIKNESNFNPRATSHCGAQGLMQLMPGTARGLGVQNAYDPGQNIMGGAKYIGQLMKQFGGDMRLAVAAYNAGPGNVKKHGGVPPFKETQNYVVKVMASYQEYKTQG